MPVGSSDWEKPVEYRALDTYNGGSGFTSSESVMVVSFRLVFVAAVLGLSLAACGGGAAVEQEAPVAASPNTPIADQETLVATFITANNQAEVSSMINEARNGGQTDMEIAEYLGQSYLRAPRRRVMFSVAFIHFREGSAASGGELNAAYELGRTSSAELAAQAHAESVAAAREAAAEEAAAEAARRAEAEATEEEAEEDEEEEPRQTGWRRWVPGL